MTDRLRAPDTSWTAATGSSTGSAPAAWPTSTAPPTFSSAAASRSSCSTAATREDAEFVERFRREASAAAGLQHRHVVSVYDRGSWDGTFYIAMEYLEGRSLKALIHQEAPLDPRARGRPDDADPQRRGLRAPAAGSSTATSSRRT